VELNGFLLIASFQELMLDFKTNCSRIKKKISFQLSAQSGYQFILFSFS